MSISIEDGIVDESWSFFYDKEKVTLKVEGPKLHHCLFMRNRSGFRGKHPWEIFFRVLNELVWYYDIKVKDISGAHGQFSANANFLPSDDGYAIRLDTFEQQIVRDDQHLALGLYREAVSSGSAYYEFLCYAKILEIPFKDGKSKGAWVDREILNLKGPMAILMRDRKVDMLGEKSLGMWLKEDGRDALSHANIYGRQLVRNPNNFQDWDDIKWGNTVMSELATKVITDQLGVYKTLV